MNSMKLYLMRASSSSHIKQQGYGASKSPDEALVSIKKCLFEELGPGENGWYYGSDGLRSPYHFMRSPGEEVYDGVNPFLQSFRLMSLEIVGLDSEMRVNWGKICASIMM